MSFHGIFLRLITSADFGKSDYCETTEILAPFHKFRYIYTCLYKYVKVISICSLVLLNGIITTFLNALGQTPKYLSQINSS